MIYFAREEFECSCGCGQDTVDYELVTILDDVRAHFNSPVTVTSGNRCVKHNEAVGGAKGSYHVLSKAADIKVRGVLPVDVYAYLDKKYHGRYGIGRYKKWTHIDVREDSARWGY